MSSGEFNALLGVFSEGKYVLVKALGAFSPSSKIERLTAVRIVEKIRWIEVEVSCGSSSQSLKNTAPAVE